MPPDDKTFATLVAAIFTAIGVLISSLIQRGSAERLKRLEQRLQQETENRHQERQKNEERRQRDLEKVRQYASGESRPDLGMTELSGEDLKGLNLRGANLSRSVLSGAILAWADLSEANLSNANLRGANLVEANLDNAILRGTSNSRFDLTLTAARIGGMLGAAVRVALVRMRRLADGHTSHSIRRCSVWPGPG